MTGTASVFKRELKAYFATPLAYVFIVIFLMMTGVFTFYVGQFFERGRADLAPFFTYHPWLYLFLVPAVAMRLWAEEPVSTAGAVLGKYLAAWAFTAIALALTFPVWITVNYLGDPDNGVILAGYVGSLLMAGGYLAIGAALSALTRNQVVAFVLTVTVCFLFTVAGLPLVLDVFAGWAPQPLVGLVASFSFLTHFNAIVQGVIDGRDLVFFASLIAFWLFVNWIIVDAKREVG